ncbi:SMP-30/gluconolactonase/LRE family protein [Thermaurantiacus sp.]
MGLLSLSPADFTPIAVGIDRPEDVVVAPTGRVFASDHQCSVAEIHGDGSFTRLGPKGGAPNGLAMDGQGRILIANFGIYDGEPGPLQRFDPGTGHHETLVAEVEGRTLSSSNYPVVAADGTIWCTHSTWAETWPQALDGRDDGFVFALLPDGQVKVAARGLRFANGCALDSGDRYLYVNQTSAANVLRFPVEGPGELGPAEPFGPALGPLLSGPVDPAHLPPPDISQHLGYTDGNGFDAEGNLWVTLPAANKIVAIHPDQSVTTVVHDPEGKVLNHPTNITWGGPDLRDLYVGSIRAHYVLKARSPVPGMAKLHQRG